MPVGQVNNPQMKDILDGEFQRSSDPSFLARIAISKYLNLPGLKGFWGPFTFYFAGIFYAGGSTGIDFFRYSPTNGLFRTYTGFSSFELDGTRRMEATMTPDVYDITMAEAHIADHGIAMGCWVKPTRLGVYAVDQGVLSKWNENTNNRSYLLRLEAAVGHDVSFVLSDDGIRYWGFRNTWPLIENRWHFIAVTYTPSGYNGEGIGARIWVNDHLQYFPAATYRIPGGGGMPLLPPSIFVSAPLFTLGSFVDAAGAQSYLAAEATNWWICGNYVSEGDIWNLYETTKYLFGYGQEKGSSW